MGAGLSGLSCAKILEENGLSPYIFEKRSEVGDRFTNCEILLSPLSKPINDAIKFLAEEYHLYLQPQYNIQKLALYSENKKAEITGNLGFTNLRGRAKNSFEKQLEKQIKSKIIFKSKNTYEELLQEYTHVVLATGDAAYATKIQDYKVDLTVTLKGVNVEGEFDPYTVRAWLNNKLAPGGYGYLIPISHTEAHIVIGYPEYQKNQVNDKEELWNKFLKEVSTTLTQKFKIKDHFEINKYIIGLCKYPRLGNTFFTGNNFGSIMPFLGFGQVEAILTGIYAAYDICGKGKYEEMIEPLRESYQESLALRKTFEKMDNKNFDFMVAHLNGTLGQKVFNGKYNYLKLASKLLKPLTMVSL